MSENREVQFVSDSEGRATGVIVPIALWHEIASERETAYLLKSDVMKARLLEAKESGEGVPLSDVRSRLGI